MISLLALTLTLSAATPPVLTLDEALGEARQNNLDLKVARARLEQSLLLSRRAWAAYLPTVSVGGSYTRNSFESVLTLPGGGDPITIVPYNQFGARAEVRQALIAPSLWPAIRNAGIAEDVAKLSTENARREVLFAVAQAYFGAASFQEAIRATQFLLEVNAAREKDTQARFDAGTVTRVALLRAKLDRTRSEQDLVRARNAYDASRLALATLLQRESTDFSLQLPAVPEVPAVDPELARKAQDARPDVAAARRNLDLAVGRRQGAWFAYAPSVGFSGVYQATNAAGFAQASSWQLVLSANWTLWDGGLREVTLREESARVAEAAAQQKQAETRVSQEVATSRLDYDNARSNLSKAEEALSLARETQRLTEISFKAGVGTYLEVADANAALTNAEVSAINERLNTSLAALRLQRASGLWEANN